MRSVLITLSLILALAGCGKIDSAVDNCASQAQADNKIRRQMFVLMAHEVIWTRGYLKAVQNRTGDDTVIAGRLMKNQEDIGDVFETYYGSKAGANVTVLLKDHIRLTLELIDNVSSGVSGDNFNNINSSLQTNGYAIADYLASINPNWKNDDMREAWNKYLSTTNAEIVSRNGKDWGADALSFDITLDHMLMFSDVLCDGIIKQFPNKFK